MEVTRGGDSETSGELADSNGGSEVLAKSAEDAVEQANPDVSLGIGVTVAQQTLDLLV